MVPIRGRIAITIHIFNGHGTVWLEYLETADPMDIKENSGRKRDIQENGERHRECPSIPVPGQQPNL